MADWCQASTTSGSTVEAGLLLDLNRAGVSLIRTLVLPVVLVQVEPVRRRHADRFSDPAQGVLQPRQGPQEATPGGPRLVAQVGQDLPDVGVDKLPQGVDAEGFDLGHDVAERAAAVGGPVV